LAISDRKDQSVTGVATPWRAASLLSSDLSDEALAKSEALAKEDARPKGSARLDLLSITNMKSFCANIVKDDRRAYEHSAASVEPLDEA
ncbi:MAG TPA: hypothetical protein VK673_11715, partial [Chthoniobacterales bacterium]|nr:hypothetical protein [Chthoniobacterales bacterium]